MATYFTDFGSDTTGALPSTWTHQVVDGTATGTVVADAGYTAGKALRFDVTVQGRNGFKWDNIDADGDRADVEMLMRVKLTTKQTSGTHLGGWGRGSGTTDTDVTGYVPAIQPDSLNFTRYESGTYTDMGGSFLAWDTSSWYWFRSRMNGTALKMRVWADGDTEPATWDVEITDANISAAGSVGVFVFRAGTYDVDVFGVGTAGDTAPSSSSSSLSTPANFTLTSSSAVRQLDGSWNPVAEAGTYDWEVERDDGGTWVAFQSGNTGSTTFQLTDADGVAWSTTYRARARAVPPVA